MPIHNIIDYRDRKYRTLVDVVFEPSWHDNSNNNADQFEIEYEDFSTDELKNTTIHSAIEYSNKWSVPVTMFIYDIRE